MCTVKPYRILNEGFRTFCRKASLPFPGEWTWGCGITFDIFTHDLHGSVINLLIKEKIQVCDIQVDDLAEGYNVVTSYKENTWKQSVKIKRDMVEICCFKASYKQITWKQAVKIKQDMVEICCFKASY